VSRVLNNEKGIRQEIRERVLTAAAGLGYQGGAVRLTHIHVFMSTGASSNDPFHADILTGIEAACRQNDIRLSHTVIGAELTDEARAQVLDQIKSSTSNGIVLLAIDDRALIEQTLTLTSDVVLVNAEQRDLPIDTLLPDNHLGPRLIVRYLMERGHRHILHVTRTKRVTIEQRFKAFKEALQEAGLPFDPRLVVETEGLSAASAYERVKAFLAQDPPRFSAVFCANDFSAMGVMRALQETGYRVPQDISLIGYDDISTAAFMVPPLTTIRLERAELGRLAVQRLIERAIHRHLIPVRLEIFPRLVERESVATLTETLERKLEP
jgi:LacI family transcriptional regulator